jgi:hypothetical protein
MRAGDEPREEGILVMLALFTLPKLMVVPSASSCAVMRCRSCCLFCQGVAEGRQCWVHCSISGAALPRLLGVYCPSCVFAACVVPCCCALQVWMSLLQERQGAAE